MYCDGRVKSIHQVKASKETTIGAFHEALYYMAKGMIDSEYDVGEAYLHTANELKCTDWCEEIKLAINNFVPNKIAFFSQILGSEKELDKEVSLLKTKIKDNFHIDKRTSKEQLAILDILQHTSLAEINSNSVRNAVNIYLQNLQKPNFTERLIFKKIKRYCYSDNRTYLPLTETNNIIESLIKGLWGEEVTQLRELSVHEYRHQLQQIIDNHVEQRHKNFKHRKTNTFNTV